MNAIQQFWQAFCVAQQLENVEYKSAFQLGVEADWLARLVVEGKKTATTSGYIFYELENEVLPQVGEYHIVLNAKDEPVAVIKNQTVEVLPMNEVSEEFALAEGEGDYQYWWKAHEEFFTELLQQYNKEFTDDLLVVCERFTCVYAKEGF